MTMASNWLLSDYHRHRNILPFLTWAFFLSEAFKQAVGEARGVALADDLTLQDNSIDQTDDIATSVPDESVPLRNWTVPTESGEQAPVVAVMPEAHPLPVAPIPPPTLLQDTPHSGGNRVDSGMEHPDASTAVAITVQNAGMLLDDHYPYTPLDMNIDQGVSIEMETGAVSLVVQASGLCGLLGTIVDVLLPDEGLAGGTAGSLALVEPVLALDILPEPVDAVTGNFLINDSVVPSALLHVEMLGGPGDDLSSGTRYSDYAIALKVGPLSTTETPNLSADPTGQFELGPMALADDILGHSTQHDLQHSVVALPGLDDVVRGPLDLIS